MFTNGAMTIYNKYTSPATKDVVYVAKTIDNVFWDSIEAVNEKNDKSDEVVVYLPTEKNDMSNYVDPKKYKGDVDTWTIKEGDIIIRGNYVDALPYIEKIADLKDYETFTIYFIDDNDFGSNNMQHIKIRGK